MNEQEFQMPMVKPQMTQPSPENNPSKPNTVVIVVFITVIVLIIAGLYMFLNTKTTSTFIKDSVTPLTHNDSDLKISYTEASSSLENSAPAFNAISKSSVASADITTLTKYIESSTPTNLPPIAQANKIISTYPTLLKSFDENATKPYLCNLGRGESCFLNSVRGMTYLAGVKALVSFEQNKISEAQKTASNIVSLGKNITANADTEITLLIGWVAQKTGYSVLSIINSKNKTPLFSETEKNALIAQLRNEQKKILKYGYTRTAEGIDYITSPDKKPVNQAMSADDEAAIGEYRKSILENAKAWNPIETKKYFYDSYKIMISSIDLPCGTSLPESKIDIGFNPEDKNTENYIGKTMYSTAYFGLNTLSVKRCEIEMMIQKL